MAGEIFGTSNIIVVITDMVRGLVDTHAWAGLDYNRQHQGSCFTYSL